MRLTDQSRRDPALPLAGKQAASDGINVGEHQRTGLFFGFSLRFQRRLHEGEGGGVDNHIFVGRLPKFDQRQRYLDHLTIIVVSEHTAVLALFPHADRVASADFEHRSSLFTESLKYVELAQPELNPTPLDQYRTPPGFPSA